MKRSTHPPGKTVPTGESRSLVAVISRGKSQTPEQRTFQKLIEKIERTREQLKAWEDYAHQYQRRLAGEVEPLENQLHMKQREMALLIGNILDGQAPYTRMRSSDRTMLRELLRELLTAMPEEGPDKELTALRAKYAPARRKRQEIDIEELLQQAEKSLNEGEEEAHHSSGRPGNQRSQDGRGRKKGTAGHGPAAAANAVSPSLRDAYRKLVSVLHPDRERDPEERERKNELMQRVNQAYETQDLLTLLSLQVELANLDVKQLASPERVTQYNQVLREQLSRLESQLSGMRLAFAPLMGRIIRTLSIQAVDKQLTNEISKLQAALEALLNDMAVFRDPVKLRARLDLAKEERKQDRYIEQMLMEVEALLEMGIDGLSDEPPRRRRRPGKKRKGGKRRRSP